MFFSKKNNFWLTTSFYRPITYLSFTRLNTSIFNTYFSLFYHKSQFPFVISQHLLG